jgi:hypothetical protein
MMKILLNILLLLVVHQVALSQTPDTIPVRRDTADVPTVSLPVLSDTTQYNDTTILTTPAGNDTIVKKKVHSPRRATMRSLIIPGWGQIYNKKYWKVPIVYGAIGFPAYLFFDNRKWFIRTKYALAVVANNSPQDSIELVHPQLRALVDRKALGSLVNYRNQFRKNMDYSILFTILMWGLNIVDATVDGHLKEFDVSDELSFKIKPVLMNGSGTPGLSLVVHFK